MPIWAEAQWLLQEGPYLALMTSRGTSGRQGSGWGPRLPDHMSSHQPGKPAQWAPAWGRALFLTLPPTAPPLHFLAVKPLCGKWEMSGTFLEGAGTFSQARMEARLWGPQSRFHDLFSPPTVARLGLSMDQKMERCAILRASGC